MKLLQDQIVLTDFKNLWNLSFYNSKILKYRTFKNERQFNTKLNSRINELLDLLSCEIVLSSVKYW